MEEIDKTSTTYFMTQMTQEEFTEWLKFRPPSSIKMGFENGLSREERYIFNKIKSDRSEMFGVMNER